MDCRPRRRGHRLLPTRRERIEYERRLDGTETVVKVIEDHDHGRIGTDGAARRLMVEQGQ